MKARLSYSLSALDYKPFCEIEVFDNSSDASMVEIAMGETFAEAREKVIERVRNALLKRGDPLEDGRTVCQKCCVADTGKIIDALIESGKYKRIL